MESRWWEIEAWPTASEWQAVWAFATALIALVAAWIAIRELKSHYESRREQARPYVVVDFGFRNLALTIDVKNTGATPAYDIEIQWDPIPISPEKTQTEVLRKNLSERKIPFLAPDRCIQYLVSQAPDYLKNGDLPRQYTVVAKYRSSDRHDYGKDEVMILDLDQWSDSLVPYDGFRHIGSKIDAQSKKTDGLVQPLRALSSTVDRFSKSMGELAKALTTSMNQTNQVEWLVSYPAEDRVSITNVGNCSADDLIVEDVSGEHSGFRLIDKESTKRLTVGESIEALLLNSLASPIATEVHLTWTENGRTKDQTLCLM